MSRAGAEREKSVAALKSVVAAAVLTGLKIVVGAWSGSIGILAEAAHSGLDLVAAVVTYIAVRASSQPADKRHLYGHGKVENLSAMVETGLLLATCAWVIYEAVKRLVSATVHVEATLWAFGVVVVSIVVDVSRSRMLKRAAAKHRSQALEADALHFSTDVWSSLVVLVGLVGVRLAAAVPSLAFLVKADAVAALGVAAIVIVVSWRLGVRTVDELLDTAPNGKAEEIKAAVEAMSGVRDCHAVRIRQSGAHRFVDLHVLLDADQTLEAAHALTDRIEAEVQRVLPDADVTVHPEPWKSPKEEEARDQWNRS